MSRAKQQRILPRPLGACQLLEAGTAEEDVVAGTEEEKTTSAQSECPANAKAHPVAPDSVDESHPESIASSVQHADQREFGVITLPIAIQHHSFSPVQGSHILPISHPFLSLSEVYKLHFITYLEI